MICKPKWRALSAASAALSVLFLAACSEPAADITPIEEAKAALGRGDGITAEVALRAELGTGAPRDTVAAYFGKAELLQGNLAEAAGWLAPREFDEQTRGLGFHTLGRVEMQTGNLAAAGQAFDQAYRFSPDDPELWTDIGRLRFRGGEQFQAVEASRKAVELGPENARALLFRGQLVRDASGLQAALPWLESAVQAAPRDVETLTEYAATLGELGRAKEMLVAIRKIARIDPVNRRIFTLQAVLAARGGNYDLALSLLRRSGELERQVPAAMLLSGIIDLQNDNAATAAQTFIRLAEIQPENCRVQPLLARALIQGGNYRELVYRFGEAAKRGEASPYITVVVARAQEALGERGEAGKLLDRAANWRPGRLVHLEGAIALNVLQNRRELAANHSVALVRNLNVAGQYADAIRRARQLTQKYPGSADALSLQGDVLLAAGQTGAALEAYRKSAEVRRPWRLTKRMVYAYRRAGRGGQADRLLARYLSDDSANAEAGTLLAKALFAAKDFAAAAMVADHVLASGAGSNPELLTIRAQIADGRGETDALERARDTVAVQPFNRGSQRVLAKVLAARD